MSNEVPSNENKGEIVIGNENVQENVSAPVAESGTESKPETQQNNVLLSAPTNTPQQPVKAEEPKINKELKEIFVKASESDLREIIDALKKDIFRLKFINDKGSTQIDNKTYEPISKGQSKKIMKAVKKTRLLRTDIMEYGNDGALTLEQLKEKYSDILDEDTDENDITNPDMVNEIIGQYIISKKAEIYFGIQDADRYVLNDLVMIIGLYESRNNFFPS